MKKIKSIIYLAGVVINQNKLKKFIDWEMPNVYCHHLTVKYGNINELPEFLGMKFKFNVDKIFFNEKAVAASGSVNSEFIKNIMKETDQHAHITICTAKDIAPVYSNELLQIGDSINYKDEITLKLGAYVVFEDGTKNWVFKK